jgi:hypothetical protein
MFGTSAAYQKGYGLTRKMDIAGPVGARWLRAIPMYCVECGEALESILERMRKVCSVCYFGHRFQAEHRPADLAPGRSTNEKGSERSPSWGLVGRGDSGHDATRIVPHIPQGDPPDGLVTKELV